MGSAHPSFTIDIDTGGTFTDGFVRSPGASVMAKVDTTPHDLTLGILTCLDRAAELLELDRRALLAATTTVRLSTTVGTNALINRTGPKVGLLLDSRLYRDLAGGLSEAVPISSELIVELPPSDPGWDGALGAVKHVLDRGARVIVIALAGDDGTVAEQSLRERIALEYPRHYLGAVPVLASGRVSRTPDAGARVRTAVLNAYLHPLMSRFLYRVEDELRREGYRYPLLVGNADGGSSRVAKTTAIRTWGSGPAGGVAGAAHIAREVGASALIALDVGGTSSDIAFIRDGRWRYVVEPRIGGAPAAVPLLELESVGIGGGSVVRVVDGRVMVGPDSVGAQPGPAAFGLGGEDATLTDAFCCCGVFDPSHFLGGRKQLDIDAARAVFAPIAAQLGTDRAAAAEQAIRAAAQVVVDSIRAILTARGADPSEVELLASGGAGGLLGCSIAALAGLRAVRAFPVAPVFSAFGLSVLERMHSYELPATPSDLVATVDAAIERARLDMQTEGVEVAALRCTLEIETGTDGTVVAEDLGPVSDGADAAARIQADGRPARLVRLRVVAQADSAPPEQPGLAERTAGPRQVFWEGGVRETPVTSWASLRKGQRIDGPAIIEADETTFLTPPGFRISVERRGDLLVTPASRGGN